MNKTKEKYRKGSIFLYVLIICSIIMIFTSSLVTLLNDDQLYTYSQINAAKSYHLAESAIDEVLNKIYLTVDHIINQYLLDLKEYKVNYIIDSNNQNNEGIIYNPPIFYNYIYIGFLSKLSSFKYEIKNPFEDYPKDHSYKIDIEYDSKNKIIIINSLATYGMTRKFIKVELCVPEIIEDGQDEYNLPNIKIRSIYIKSKYQTFGV